VDAPVSGFGEGGRGVLDAPRGAVAPPRAPSVVRGTRL